jgi:conjugal transfer pilus assembly protein TraD
MAIKIDPFIRFPHEVIIGATWCLAGLFSLSTALYFQYQPFLLPALIYLGFAVYFGVLSFKVVGRKTAGKKKLFSLFSVSHLLKKNIHQALWFGWGFDWMPIHTQRAVDYAMAGIDEEADPNFPGNKWIHGVNLDKEKDINIPLKALEGHTIMFGTTGSGKTRAFEIMIAEAIHRGDTVIVIDPKGDHELKERMRIECRRSRRDDAFLYFHPAFPRSSIRLDCMRNYTRTTEIASRVSAIIPSSSGGSDQFTAFCFNALNLVASGLEEVGRRPTLSELLFYIQGGPEALLVKAIQAYGSKVDMDFQDNLDRYIQKAKLKQIKAMETITNQEWLGVIEYYRATLAGTDSGSKSLDGLLAMVEHNRTHFSKMIASLIPILNMLTSGEMGGLLSPNGDDIDDTRPIYDSSMILKGKHVLYVALDSLSDSMVASAIGSLLLSDFATAAGRIYNSNISHGRITLFVDEAAEVVNMPFIQLLNKGRGAGFNIVMATQTMPDLTSRLGDEAKARMVLGNVNNLISLRIKDGETQKYVCESFGKTFIKSVNETIGSSGSTTDNIAHFSGSRTQTIGYTEYDLFPQQLLGQLPNFHYIAAIAGGRVIKGRLPILEK